MLHSCFTGVCYPEALPDESLAGFLLFQPPSACSTSSQIPMPGRGG